MVIDLVWVILLHFIYKIDIYELQNVKLCIQTTIGLHKGQRPEFFGFKNGLFGENLLFSKVLCVLTYFSNNGLCKGWSPKIITVSTTYAIILSIQRLWILIFNSFLSLKLTKIKIWSTWNCQTAPYRLKISQNWFHVKSYW